MLSESLYSIFQNLSHAVTVVCYELSQQARSHRVPERLPRVPDVASTSNLLDEDVSTSRGESAILQHPHQDTEVSSPGSNNDQSVEPASVTAEESASSEMSELSTSEGSGERGMEISQLAGQLERDTCAESGARDREKSQSGQLEGARPAESPINSKLSLSEESGEWDVEIPRSEQLEREGPVESADAPNRPGWRKTRRLDRALKRTDVADGADVEGALKQAEDLLTKVRPNFDLSDVRTHCLLSISLLPY